MELDRTDWFRILLVTIFCGALTVIGVFPDPGKTTTEEQITIVSYTFCDNGAILVLTPDGRVFRVSEPDSLRITAHQMPYSCAVSVKTYPSFLNIHPQASLLSNASAASGSDGRC